MKKKVREKEDEVEKERIRSEQRMDRAKEELEKVCNNTFTLYYRNSISLTHILCICLYTQLAFLLYQTHLYNTTGEGEVTRREDATKAGRCTRGGEAQVYGE